MDSYVNNCYNYFGETCFSNYSSDSGQVVPRGLVITILELGFEGLGGLGIVQMKVSQIHIVVLD